MGNHAAQDTVYEACYGPDPDEQVPECDGVGTAPVPEHIARALAREALSSLALPALKQGQGRRAPSDAEIERLCDALVSDDPESAQMLIAQAQRGGAAPDTLYLGYVAGAARRLGERWVNDTASFVDVTVGLGRLHGILRDLGPAFFSSEPVELIGLDALFAAAPGETHILGVVMATDFFRRRGWHVDIDTSPAPGALVAAASRRHYAVIGLSASSRRMIESLASTVRELRPVSNGALIVIGGHINDLEPDIVRLTGADATARDAPSAARSLEQMVATAPR